MMATVVWQPLSAISVLAFWLEKVAILHEHKLPRGQRQGIMLGTGTFAPARILAYASAPELTPPQPTIGT